MEPRISIITLEVAHADSWKFNEDGSLVIE
jgi:hypothetical protein